MKALWVPLSLLVSLSTLLLFYQWSDAQANADNNSKPPLRLDIGMEVKDERVHIDFTYDSLRPGIYSIIMPDEASDLQCSSEGDDACEIIEKAQPRLNLETNETVTFQYKLPFSRADVLMEWMLVLERDGEEVDPPFTLTMKDYNKLESTWEAPASKSSDIVMDNLRYLEFEQNTGAMPLIQPSEEKVWHLGDSVVTFEDEKSLSASAKDDLERLLTVAGPAIVELDRPEVVLKDGYMTTKGHDIKALESEYISSHIKAIANVENSWEADVIKNVFHQRETPVAQEILTSLSEPQLTRWKQLLLAGEDVTDIHKFLDQTLAEVYGLETTFFRKHDREGNRPLYFSHPKETIVEGTEITDEVIDYQGSTYFPLSELTTNAGYELTEIEPREIYRVKMPETMYRFFVDESTFIMNEESFGIGEDLLKIINGKPYIKADFVEELLDLRIFSRENSFRLQKK